MEAKKNVWDAHAFVQLLIFAYDINKWNKQNAQFSQLTFSYCIAHSKN